MIRGNCCKPVGLWLELEQQVNVLVANFPLLIPVHPVTLQTPLLLIVCWFPPITQVPALFKKLREVRALKSDCNHSLAKRNFLTLQRSVPRGQLEHVGSLITSAHRAAAFISWTAAERLCPFLMIFLLSDTHKRLGLLMNQSQSSNKRVN